MNDSHATLSEFFRSGGWGMWPTLLFGALALGLSVRHAFAPKAQYVPLIIGLGGATLFAGALGFATGLVATAEGVITSAGVEPRLLVAGVAESLSNVVLALLLTTLVSLAAGIGSYRAKVLELEPAR